MNEKIKFQITEFDREFGILADEMRNYNNFYTHRSPCKAWKEDGWCKHFIKARYQKFKERIHGQLDKMVQLNGNLRKSGKP